MSEAELKRRRQLRTALLKKVYDRCDGSVIGGVNGEKVAEEIGIKDSDWTSLRMPPSTWKVRI